MTTEVEAAPGATKRENEVWTLFCRRAQASLRHSAEWRKEARELYDKIAGRQWSTEDEAAMREVNKPMVTFNLMAKFIDAVVGLQINNRQDIRAYPRHLGNAAVSEVATGALAWSRDACDAVFEETDAGHDCLLTGMGWTETFLNDELDPAGTIDKERRDPLEMLWDPMARKKNLMDGRYVIRVRPYSVDQYEEKFGDKPVGSLSFAGLHDTQVGDIVKVIHTPHDYGDGGPSSNHDDMVLVADYQWWEMEDAVYVTATFPNDPQPTKRRFSKAEWKEIAPQLAVAGILYQEESVRQRVYYRATMGPDGVQGKIRKSPYQEGFTFEAITGKRDRNTNTWIGIGRNLVDPQNWVNKFFSSMIWQLSVGAKGGLLVEEGAFASLERLKNTWADPSQVTVLEEGAITNNRIQQKQQAPYPTGMDRLMQFSMEALPETSGLNAEILGLTNRDQAGVVEAQRKQGAMAIIAWFFDALHRHYKSSGKLTLSLVRDYVADDRLIRIVGEEGAKYVPLARKSLQEDFDFIVDEAPTSVNMRERVWAVLQIIIPMALQAGIKVPKAVLDYAPIPEDLAQKWKKELEGSPEEAQIAMRGAQAQVRKDETAADLNAAKAEDIRSKTPGEVAKTQADTMKTAAEIGQNLAGGA